MQPEVERYLEQVHRLVIEAWEVERGTEAHDVVAYLRLNEQGAVTHFAIADAPNEAFAQLATAAIREAQPFGPVPPDAECLTNYPFRFTFSTFVLD